MAKFEPGQALAAIAIQQLVNDWGEELDNHEGLNMGQLVSRDCTYHVRNAPRHGREAVVQFYAQRLKELQDKGVVMTQRHAISNLRVRFASESEAEMTFLLTYYMSFSKPPVTDLSGPVAVADCQMRATLESDGHWRIAFFDSVQNFKRPPK